MNKQSRGKIQSEGHRFYRKLLADTNSKDTSNVSTFITSPPPPPPPQENKFPAIPSTPPIYPSLAPPYFENPITPLSGSEPKTNGIYLFLVPLFFLFCLLVTYLWRFICCCPCIPATIFYRRPENTVPQSTFGSNVEPALCKGLDPSIIDSLPVLSYNFEDMKQHSDCVICLGGFEETEAVKALPFCTHMFHPQCIDMWLMSHVTCPICRTSILCDAGSVDGIELNQ